jgi:hypothetical protein
MRFSNNDPNTLQVRIPTTPGQVMGVADPITVNRAFVTDFTARHEGNLPDKVNKKYSTEA